jgi:7-keto-8-aminopelargonate synthetase-like enzyme
MLNHNPPLAPWVTARRARWIATAGLASLALSACGSSSSSSSTSATPAAQVPTHLLNTKRVALAIAQSILSERQLHAKVTCPPAVPQAKGRTFTCVAATESHSQHVRTVFTVLQQNDQGKVYYASPK